MKLFTQKCSISSLKSFIYPMDPYKWTSGRIQLFLEWGRKWLFEKIYTPVFLFEVITSYYYLSEENIQWTPLFSWLKLLHHIITFQRKIYSEHPCFPVWSYYIILIPFRGKYTVNTPVFLFEVITLYYYLSEEDTQNAFLDVCLNLLA